jgi:type I restriction enzyme M protein
MASHGATVAFLWSIADLLRDHFKRAKYPDVILPFTVLRRLDAVLEPTKDDVRAAYLKAKDDLDDLDPVLRGKAGYAFYNTSPYTFERLLQDPPALGDNLRAYLQGFSPNMRTVVERFDLDNTIKKLEDAGLLYLVVERFAQADLGPEDLDNHGMGYVFEELIRKFNEATNENPGEHFTPREVVHLMTALTLAPDAEILATPNRVVTVYDPCCGTGGMLTAAKDWIEEWNPQADVRLAGQEVNPETWAVAKSDLFMKSETGRDAEAIAFGSTLSEDGHPRARYDYQLANPPYGKDWKSDKAAVNTEAARGHAGRFGVGTPTIRDGQLLFLQHMVSKMRAPEDGGGRFAVIHNGSPLFNGDAASGESEIRRWLLENDWIEAIIALPEQLFYNTSIATYVWVLSNRKPAARQGVVQLIDASGPEFWAPMPKSLGDKRRKLTGDHVQAILDLYESVEGSGPDAETPHPHARLFPTDHFGYRKVQVERPLRLNLEASPERIARLDDETEFQKLARSTKKDPQAKAAAIAAGREEQDRIRHLLRTLAGTRYTDAAVFLDDLAAAADAQGVKVLSKMREAIVSALGEPDPSAEIVRDSKGRPVPDVDLRDHEMVPFGESIHDFVAREVLPYAPDAWIDESYTDHQDGGVGRVGYEISFTRYFYQYEPPRELDAIEADLKGLEAEILELLGEVTA